MIAEHMYWCLMSLRCINRRWQTRPRCSRSCQPTVCGGWCVVPPLHRSASDCSSVRVALVVRLVLLSELQAVLCQDTVRHGPHCEFVHQGTRIRRIQLVCVGTRIWMWVLVIVLVLVLVFVRVRDEPNVRVTQYTDRWTDGGASTFRSDRIP